MSFLVTGGTGLLGAHVVAELVACGHQTVAYDIRTSSGVAPLVAGATVLRGTTLDPHALAGTVRDHGVRCIINCAAELSAIVDSAPFVGFQTNVLGVANLLEIARLHACKLITVSSASVYDHRQAGATDRVGEDHPLSPPFLYAATKLCADYLGIAYAREHGVPFVGMRACRFYGAGGYQYPGASPNAGAGMMADVIAGIARGHRVRLIPEGRPMNEWLYVKDVAHALVLAATLEYPTQEKWSVLNIGSGHLYHFDEIVTATRKAFPDADIDVVSLAGRERNSVHWTMPFDITRAGRDLGWQPRFDFESAIRDAVAVQRCLDSAAEAPVR